MRSTTLIITYLLISTLTGPSLGLEILAQEVNNSFSGNSEIQLGS